MNKEEGRIYAKMCKDLADNSRLRFLELMDAVLMSPHIDHEHHLCAKVEIGTVSLEQLKDLIREPNFICKFCGRAAVKEDNLCEPVTILQGSCGLV
jgi:hypothetical protein